MLLHLRDDRLVKVEGDREFPLNHGRLCPIGTVTLDLVYHPDRLKYPLHRIGARGSGKWNGIRGIRRLMRSRSGCSQSDVNLAPRRLRSARVPGAIIFAGSRASGMRSARQTGASRNFRAVLSSARQYLSFDLRRLPRIGLYRRRFAHCIMFWGHNPTNSGPDGETRFNVLEALNHKPKIIVIDPRQTDLAKRADLWLQIRPGVDDALALSMLNVIISEKLYDEPFVARWTHGFEALGQRIMAYSPEWAEPITWVGADKIRAATRLFATTKPALLEWGCAIEHTPKCIQTVRAVSMLPALTANIDVPGGWVFGMHGLGRFPSLIENLTPEANAKRLGADQFKLLGGEGADLPAAHIPTLLRAMREGKPYPVKAFLVFGNNTLSTYANTALVYDSLMKLDFMVCADLFMTPTAELADIVLPAASWPELNQLAGLPTIAANVVLAQQKSVRIGECKSDEEIFVELARRMRLPVGTETVEDVLDAQLAAGKVGMTFDQLKQRGFFQVPFKYRKFEDGVQDTDRKDRTLLDAPGSARISAAATL